jgi:hypothetical protein
MLGKGHDFRTCTWEIAMTWQDPYDPYRQNAQDPPGQSPYDPYRQNAHDPPGQGPYGPYGHNPTGQPGWHDPHAQYGHGYYGPPGVPPMSTGGTVAALIANIVSAILCCVGLAWLPGIILAALALGRAGTDPLGARRLTMWAWVCFGADLVLVVALLVLFGVFAGDPGSGAATP